MATKLFKKSDLLDMLYGAELNNIEHIEDNIMDNSRWSIIHSLVFKDLDTGKFYASNYSIGATECQDESPYQYEDDMIECVEVTPVEVTVIEYKPVD